MLNEEEDWLDFLTHRRISCSMEVGRASTPTWCRIWATVNLLGNLILARNHLLQPSEKLVQGLPKGGKGLSDDKKSDLVGRLWQMGTHPPPPAWGFSIRLLSISFRCCLNRSQSFFNIFCFSLSRCCSWLDLERITIMKKQKYLGLPPVFQKQCFSATPENAHILHFDIKVQVAADLERSHFSSDIFSKHSCSPAPCTCPHSPCSGTVLEAGQCKGINFHKNFL